MPASEPPPRRPPAIEHALERAIFASRWLLAPFYLGLAGGLAVLLVKFAQEAVALILHTAALSAAGVIVGLLALIDLSLMGSLVMMVILAGYESFVSRLDIASHHDRLEWMGRVGFSELKLKLMASIVAISAIRLLEGFMNVGHLTDRDLAWQVGIHLTFVVSGVLLALMDRLTGGDGH